MTEADGWLLVPEVPLGAVPARYPDDLVGWAKATPGAAFVAERHGEGWRSVSYADTLARVRRIGAGVLAGGAHAGEPVAIVAENSVDNALLALACTYVGVPYAPISVAAAGEDANGDRLRAVVDALTPSLIYAPDAGVAWRLADAAPGVRIVTDVGAFDGSPASADDAFARVKPETVAKILFTSGSTGMPKGVITTNRMLCANQTMIAQAFPQLREPVTLVDWLPWSHTFGGSFCFGIVLRSGGTLWVDEGKPFSSSFERTLVNLREIAPTAYFNVPRGHALVVDALEREPDLAARFFERLNVIVNAGAAWPPALRAAYVRLAQTTTGREIATQSCWGATETAPLSTTCWGLRPADPDTIGTPVPGNEIKLAPVSDRFEIRVRGENVTPGYWRDPAATAAAFDADGFYRTGDAGELLDANDPSRGIVFRGRLAENFKLSSGTWVNVGALRAAVIEACAPLIDDVVVAGHDRDEIALLLFVNLVHAQRLASLDIPDRDVLVRRPAVREHVMRAMQAHNARWHGTSLRVARSLLLTDAPNRDEGELTEKGTVNQRRALTLRAVAVARLYADRPDADVLIHPPAGT